MICSSCDLESNGASKPEHSPRVAEMEIRDLSPAYSHMVTDSGLISAFRRNAEELGAGVTRPRTPGLRLRCSRPTWPMCSLAVPTIHPLVRIETAGAVNHQPEFAAACVGPSATKALLDGAISMAWTAIDSATRTELRESLLTR